MKRCAHFASLILALSCVVTTILPVRAIAAESDFSFTVSGGAATITGYKGNASSVEIPSTVGGVPVTKIGEWAFDSCGTITDVTVPNGVWRIEHNAFSRCSNLERVTLPSSLNEISYNVFSMCTALKQMMIPEGVTSIGKRAFTGCSALSEISLPNTLTNLSSCNFSGCSSLSYISIPVGVGVLGEDMFAGCTGLRTIVLTSGIYKIAPDAFRNCLNFTIVAPAGSTAAKIAAKRGIPTTTEVPRDAAPAPAAQEKGDTDATGAAVDWGLDFPTIDFEVDGRVIRVYTVNIPISQREKVVEYVDVCKFDTVKMSYWRFLGEIHDCLGARVGMSYQVDKGNPGSVAWRPMVWTDTDKWTSGITANDSTWNNDYFVEDILLRNAADFSFVTCVPTEVSSQAWELRSSLVLEKLYFATEAAATNYVASVS